MAHGLEIQPKRRFSVVKIGILLAFIGLIVASVFIWYHYYTTGNLPLDVRVSALQADPGVDESDVDQSDIDSHTVMGENPRYISIPSIGVEKSRVYQVGVTSSNQLEAPTNIHDTAWYEKSAKPGMGYGAVLINGHNGGATRDGIFAGLKELAIGDTIDIERGDGKRYSYEVKENHNMSLDEVNKSGMKMMMESADASKEGLNLITCDGNWIPQLKQYDKRIMLRATLIN